jgi:DNA repair exonuclease SbcCD ATPase subunit
MASLNDYRREQQNLREAIRKVDELRGRRAALLAQVQEEWGTDDLTQFRALLAKEQARLEQQQQDYEKRYGEFQDTYRDLLAEES